MSRSSFKRPRLEESSTPSSSSNSIVPLSLSTSYDPQDDDEDDRSSNSGDDDFEFGEGYQDHAGPSGDDDDGAGEGGWSEDEEEGGRSGKGTPAKGHHSLPSSRPTTPSSASKKTPTKRKATTPKKSPKSPSSSKKTVKPTPSSGPFVRLTPSDAYFTSISAKLSLNSLSSNIFSSLLPPLTHQSYTSLLANSSSSTKHAQELDDLAAEHERRWEGWVAELTSGWNLLFYGLGSKREVLNDFAVERLSEEGDVVVVNGLYPRIGIREILGTIEEQFPEINKMDPPPPAFSSSSSSSSSTTSPLDILAYKIYTYYLPTPPNSSRSNGHSHASFKRQSSASKPLFLLLHSLDSPSLRNPLSKTILSLLASNPRIHLLASVDNINAPSIFSTTELHSRQHPPPPSSSSSQTQTHSQPHQPYLPPPERGFSFLWHDLTTLRPYTEEVSWRTSSASRLSSGVAGAGGGVGGGGGTATEEGARHILVSVTGAAKKLFRLLATNQIAAQSHHHPSTSNKSNANGSSLHKSFQTQTQPTSSSSSSTTTTTTPSYATETSLFYHQCSTSWIAREETRFRALLAEFRDHRLILESTIAPSTSTAEEDDVAAGAGGGVGGGGGKANARWLWIPLGKEALERLVGEIGED